MRTLSRRLWSRIRKGGADECWPWIPCNGRNKYGMISKEGKNRHSHRVAYELHFGPFPQHLDVLHKCDYKPCCNPNHLYLGTDLDNARDRAERGRNCQAKGEKHWNASLSEEQVVEIRTLFSSGSVSMTTLGKRFGIARPQVARIVYGFSWTNAGGPVSIPKRKALSPDSVREIMLLRAIGMTHTEIASKIGCNQSTVSLVLAGRIRKEVTGL